MNATFARSVVWIPVLVTALVTSLCLVLWSQLVGDRRAQVEHTAQLAAAQARRAVTTAVREHVAALHNLAALWATAGPRASAGWRAHANVLTESFPALAQIAWVHPDERQPSQRVSEPALRGPERDASGAIELRILLPMLRRGTDVGTLEARVDTARLLAEVLQEWVPGYAIHVQWDGEELFRRGAPLSDPSLDWWRIEGAAVLPHGAAWTVALAPTAELAAAWLAPDPNYLLVIGVALAVVLGVLMRQLLTSSARARELAASNHSLAGNTHELRQLNEMLEARVSERTAELEALTSSFSHDLKSPLGAILNFTAILEVDHRERWDADSFDILMRIRRSAARATALLDGLVRVSRVRRAVLDVQPLDMNELAHVAFARARSSEEDGDVEFVLEPLPDALGDRVLVAEALCHLFDNALKFSRGREKRTVRMRGSHAGRECVYEISDNGHGFDMRYIDKLFGMFERLHSSPDIAGNGVGLALVEKIIQRHGGRVWADSAIDAGSRFSFALPANGSTP